MSSKAVQGVAVGGLIKRSRGKAEQFEASQFHRSV